jgi:hypothetical protein
VDRWDCEDFFRWWDRQMTLIPQETAQAPAPDPTLAEAARELLRLVRKEQKLTQGRQLGEGGR